MNTKDLLRDISTPYPSSIDRGSIIALEAEEVKGGGMTKKIVDVGMPSTQARAKLNRAKMRLAKAAHKKFLAEQGMERWAKKVRYYEKKFSTPGYYEGKDAAEKMKRALGLKKDPGVTVIALPPSVVTLKGVKVSSDCGGGYHGMCKGRRMVKQKGSLSAWESKPCRCDCHKTKKARP